jgi:hypothetical protein
VLKRVDVEDPAHDGHDSKPTRGFPSYSNEGTFVPYFSRLSKLSSAEPLNK